ncbi:MAG: alanine racemase [Rhizobiaceae bacterium]
MSIIPSYGAALPDPRVAGGRLTVDLGALRANYRTLRERAAGAEVAGVVKANAYGLGIEQVGPALWAEGCRVFFVALPSEGAALRAVLPEAYIYILAGLFENGSADIYHEWGLLPVLNSRTEIAIWEAHGWDGDVPRPCAIHVDTGMNRLGLSVEEAIAFADDNALTGAVTPLVVMSHLACADEPSHPLNARQYESFQAVRRVFPQADSSLSNSAGTFMGADFAFDLVRPGIALYGGNPVPGEKPMLPVATAEARIIQLRMAKAGESVSYGAPVPLARDTRIAVAAVGYADGYHRASSGAGVPLRQALGQGGAGFAHGRRVPVLGRITMDLTMFDVTDLGEDVTHGDWIELFGANIPIDEAATTAGTIAYELLTSLGGRYDRRYLGGEAADG